MKNLAYQDRSWSLVGEGRMRPSLLKVVGHTGETEIYADARLATKRSLLYLRTNRGSYQIYRPVAA